MNRVTLDMVGGMKYLFSCLCQPVHELRAVRETILYVHLRAEFAASMGLECRQVLPTYSRRYGEWMRECLQFQVVVTP